MTRIKGKPHTAEFTLEAEWGYVTKLKKALLIHGNPSKIKDMEIDNPSSTYLQKLNRKERRRIIENCLKKANKELCDDLGLSKELMVARYMELVEDASKDTDFNGNPKPDRTSMLKAYDKIVDLMGYKAAEKKEITVRDYTIEIE